MKSRSRELKICGLKINHGVGLYTRNDEKMQIFPHCDLKLTVKVELTCLRRSTCHVNITSLSHFTLHCWCLYLPHFNYVNVIETWSWQDECKFDNTILLSEKLYEIKDIVYSFIKARNRPS